MKIDSEQLDEIRDYCTQSGQDPAAVVKEALAFWIAKLRPQRLAELRWARSIARDV